LRCRSDVRVGLGRLIEFPELGHAPQIQDPVGFDKALVEGLGGLGR
jgi:pimeloyl-ACP methyl ester carboxylesterase